MVATTPPEALSCKLTTSLALAHSGRGWRCGRADHPPPLSSTMANRHRGRRPRLGARSRRKGNSTHCFGAPRPCAEGWRVRRAVRADSTLSDIPPDRDDPAFDAESNALAGGLGGIHREALAAGVCMDESPVWCARPCSGRRRPFARAPPCELCLCGRRSQRSMIKRVCSSSPASPAFLAVPSALIARIRCLRCKSSHRARSRNGGDRLTGAAREILPESSAWPRHRRAVQQRRLGKHHQTNWRLALHQRALSQPPELRGIVVTTARTMERRLFLDLRRELPARDRYGRDASGDRDRRDGPANLFDAIHRRLASEKARNDGAAHDEIFARAMSRRSTRHVPMRSARRHAVARRRHPTRAVLPSPAARELRPTAIRADAHDSISAGEIVYAYLAPTVSSCRHWSMRCEGDRRGGSGRRRATRRRRRAARARGEGDRDRHASRTGSGSVGSGGGRGQQGRLLSSMR